MIHLFKHKDGKFDIAIISNGKYIVGSNQHYNRKAGCYKAMKAILNSIGGYGHYFQDDTLDKPKVFKIVFYDSMNTLIKTKITETSFKVSKRYVV